MKSNIYKDMRGTQITIKDIAKQLNISPSTVSRALKDHPDISEQTKKAVQELAVKLHYKPNKIALSLLQSTSNVIGIIVPEIVHHFFSTVISAVQEVAFKAGYSVMICQSNESFVREVDNTKVLLSSMVDGFLISVSKETRDFSHFEEVYKNQIPIVFFDRICEELDTDRVIFNDYQAGFMATEHLINVGCTRIAHLAAPQHLAIGRNRQNGYIQALIKNKIPIDESLILKCDKFEDGKEIVKHLMDLPNRPDGIFAVNDRTASGAMIAIKSKGYRIPEDVAVVGFSNGLIAQVTDPALTSIDQHGDEMGTVAMQQLLKRLHNASPNNEPEVKLIQPTLIIRESTKRVNL